LKGHKTITTWDRNDRQTGAAAERRRLHRLALARQGAAEGRRAGARPRTGPRSGRGPVLPVRRKGGYVTPLGID